MTSYSLTGKIQLGKHTQKFQRTIEAETQKQAEDLLQAQLGSEHSINRSKIQIQETEEA
ncbi:MAG: 50S ribosomal protein L18Ae [Candidatus Nanohaloarchaea archaeon]